MKNSLLLGLLLIINNCAYSQSTFSISKEIFDIKGIKINMSLLQVTKLIGADGRSCQTRNLAITKQKKELTAMADIVYFCQSYLLFGRQTGALEAYFIDEKLSGMSIQVGNAELDKEENKFPDFFSAIAKKFGVEPSYAKKIKSLRGGFDFESDIITDEERSSIFIDGQMLTYLDDRLRGFKNIRLFFASKDYYENVGQRLQKLKDLEKRIEEENDDKRKKDL